VTILKIVKSPYLSQKIIRFLMRFWWNLVHYIRYWTRLQSRDQKLKFLKFKMVTGTIFKIAVFGHNTLNGCPILAKFCTRKQNGMPTKATWQKTANFQTKSKMVDGRHFLKIVKSPYLIENIRFWQNLVYYVDTEPDEILKIRYDTI